MKFSRIPVPPWVFGGPGLDVWPLTESPREYGPVDAVSCRVGYPAGMQWRDRGPARMAHMIQLRGNMGRMAFSERSSR